MRYSVTGVDDSAEGMERLRDQSEFILIAYASDDSTPDDLAEQWSADIGATAQPDGFDYDAAESAVRTYCRESADYLQALIDSAVAIERRDAEERRRSFDMDDAPPLRLYVRDNAPEPLSVCVDCIAYLANGGDELEPSRAAEIAAAIERQGGHVVAACGADCEGGFSWAPCELCGSTLGGERHAAAVLQV